MVMMTWPQLLVTSDQEREPRAVYLQHLLTERVR
jgi:hypothetical protein